MITAGFILLATITVQATPVLTNLSPGGHPPTELVVETLFAAKFFDSIVDVPFTDGAGNVFPAGWVNMFFNLVNGQDYIQTDLLNEPEPVTAELESDFSGSPYLLRYINVYGHDWESIYEVRPRNRNGTSDGFVPVSLNGTTPIIGIGFYGRASVPESGSAALFFGAGLAGVALFQARMKGAASRRQANSFAEQ